MEKPITIIIQETKDQLIGIINASNLPPVILEPVVRDIYNEINTLTKMQYEKDLKEYHNKLNQENQLNNLKTEEPTV